MTPIVSSLLQNSKLASEVYLETFVNELCYKNGKLKIQFEEPLSILSSYETGKKMRPFRWGYNNKAEDRGPRYCKALDVLGLSFEYGNDAPKGGRNGDYIVLLDKNIEKVLDKIFNILKDIPHEWKWDR